MRFPAAAQRHAPQSVAAAPPECGWERAPLSVALRGAHRAAGSLGNKSRPSHPTVHRGAPLPRLRFGVAAASPGTGCRASVSACPGVVSKWVERRNAQPLEFKALNCKPKDNEGKKYKRNEVPVVDQFLQTQGPRRTLSFLLMCHSSAMAHGTRHLTPPPQLVTHVRSSPTLARKPPK